VNDRPFVEALSELARGIFAPTAQNRITLHDARTGEMIQTKTITFPGGEPHVYVPPHDGPTYIDARIANGNGLFELVVMASAVQGKCGLFLPYFPGARQDHPEPGYGGTLAAVRRVVESCCPDVVVVLDPHSKHSTVEFAGDSEYGPVVDIHGHLASAFIPREIIPAYNGVIAPDKGAVERAASFSKWLDLEMPVIQAHKTRDPHTGLLTGFGCDPLPVPGGRYLVVDDICDGGGTFVGLADAIQQTDRSSPLLDLYVTHGIFSKGLESLIKRFSRIITTDSFLSPTVISTHPRLTVVPVADFAARTMKGLLA
jgi:ribose-phosphate pyrophosphokinase